MLLRYVSAARPALTVLFCALYLNGCTTDKANSAQDPSDVAQFEPIRQQILALVDQEEIPSMAVAVTQNGSIIWEEAFGWADMENKIPATPSTVYRVGSLSKSMMATGVMPMVERGKIDLDDDVATLMAPAQLKRYDGIAGKVKVWHLLNMAAGIPHGWMGFYSHDDLPHSADGKDSLLQWIGQVVYPPGTVYHYSNFSMGLLEWVIERVTGSSFSEYMNSEMFTPLGMKHTGVREEDRFRKFIATPYGSDMEPLGDGGYLIASGGLGFYSSAHDLALYGLFNLGTPLDEQTPILSKETLHLMHTFDRGPDSLFGLGWFKGDHLVSNGSVSGGNARITLVPEHDLSVSCATNMTSPVSIADQICDDIAELLIPGSKERGRQRWEEYIRLHERPYESQPELAGVWRGFVSETGNVRQPVTVTFSKDGTVEIQLDKQDPTPLEGITLGANQFLEANFQGTVLTFPSQSLEPRRVRIHLKYGDDRMFGYAATAFTTDNGFFRLPAFVNLTRE